MSTPSVYESAFLAAPFGAFLCRPDGVFARVNAAYEQLTGYREQDLIGQCKFLALHDPAELVRRVGPSPATGAGALAQFRGEWAYVRRNGTRVPVSLAMAPLTGALEARYAGHYIGIAVDTTRHARAEARLWYVSHHDSATRLPNRELFLERLDLSLARARRSGEPLTVLVIEIDDLQKTREALGPEGADLALEYAGARLRRLAHAQCGGVPMGFIGGDQFALALPGRGDDAPEVAEALIEAFAQGEQSEQAQHNASVQARHGAKVNLNIGTARHPDDGDDAATLVRRAGVAVSEARRTGRGQVCRFARAQEQRATRQLELENALRHAIGARELFLLYQPRVSLQTGAIMQSEALLRWRHPVHGLVSPGEFIPIAEEAALIDTIGAWVMNTACRETGQLQRLAHTLPKVAVNVSPQQFVNPQFAGQIEAALERAALAPDQLEIEITESMLFADAGRTVRTLQALRALGIEVAVDDFGTGYSNLAWLASLPLNRLKIDRSFVAKMETDPRSEALVGAIISMAHALELKVTAEGIETAAQARRLRELGCDEAQGFWFSRPVSLQTLRTLIAPVPYLLTGGTYGTCEA
ncbi:diguanylate cyclase (GGDEF)-like protein/PAS domain S-box-containing protein [Paraburkholderia bannensis]|uniref:Diguanylate cyclase (GGDEF)-like protein/PAS domain S-box-containing protein n=1 Tax=Paraburkholderia bannensis TaxID=765414 RepID=A0A7W9WSZ4_9BURK|nr:MULTISPECIES: EAL domain-containing protein [Paraburkholderia]MBB3257366.1 diguanylate cyclase (GGDEF)-like protein/PAS domain S-box-containing protein [Paraburkholderia sp. WP4_3_2]MBB6102238.1 diguanylate cyclase (GGDEF)-like protein/PAS domain S-box-containing protein [Paraburkholderia bannensis]